MNARADTFFVNCRLADQRRVDIEVRDGLIDNVAAHDPARELPDAATVVDVNESLVLPPLAEPHAHLDKALTADMAPNHTGDLMGAIDAWIAAEQAGLFTQDDMVQRVRAALERLLYNGVTAVRSHVNVAGGAGLRHVAATVEAVEPFRSVMDIELVGLAFTPTVGAGSADNQATLIDSLSAGIDLVGGCPHLEADSQGAVQLALQLATEHNRRVDLHVDETLDPAVLTLRDLATQVIDGGLEGQVAASHCISLGMQTDAIQREVARMVADAGIAIVPLPQTNLFLQGRDHSVGTPRGLTAIHVLADAGVVIAAGGDNVQDPFNLVGRSDPLETAALLVMAAHVAPDEAYHMVSNAVRRTMHLAPVNFAAGDPADFVAFDAPSIRGVIADAPTDRLVVHGGRVVARTTLQRHRP